MEIEKDMPDWLNYITGPAFSVRENKIVFCNRAAEGLLLAPGTDVRTLLLTGKEEYETFQDGCLYLKLNLSSNGYGAAVTRYGDHIIFLLDQKPEDAALRSLALAAVELRNPLSNVITAANSLAKYASQDPAAQEWLSRLNRGLNQMHRLVNNMADAGITNPSPDVFLHNLGMLVHEIFEKIQTQLSGTNVTLTYEDLEEDISGYANANQLDRAILNVVSNAIKFMPDGGQIHAKLTRHKNMLHLSILDSGSGIAENVLDTVFCRYQRQPCIEDSRYGIGLGMVLARNTASDHGGTVLIDQPDGKGTRVTITMEIRQNSSEFRAPTRRPLMDNSTVILRELSDCLPWEFYKK